MVRFTYHLPTWIEFGAGTLQQVGEEARKLGKKALIVIGRGESMRRARVLDRLIKSLREQRVEAVVFDKIRPNPIIPTIDEGAELS